MGDQASPDAGTRAVIIAGAGSTREFIERAFPVMDGVVDEVLALEPHGGDLGALLGALREAVRQARSDGCRLILGGVSFGAHASAAYAIGCGSIERPDALVLAMPAWSGQPDAISLLTAATADRLQERGVPAVLDDLDALAPGDWVASELRAAWTTRPTEELIIELRAVAACPSPRLDMLAAIDVPTVVLGVSGDPLHPIDVARSWAAAIRRSSLVALTRAELGVDRSLLGRLAFGCLAGSID